MKFVQWVKRWSWVEVLRHGTILSTQLFPERRAFFQRVLNQWSHYLAEFLITHPSLASYAHRSSHFCQNLYLIWRFRCRRQQMTRPLSIIHRNVKTDCAPHTRMIHAKFTWNRNDNASTSVVSQNYDKNLKKHLQTIPSFNMTSSSISVNYGSGSKRECIPEQSILIGSFRLLDENECGIAVSSDTTSDDINLCRNTFFSSGGAPPSIFFFPLPTEKAYIAVSVVS